MTTFLNSLQDTFGVCTCGKQLPQVRTDLDGARMVYAESAYTPIEYIMTGAVAHDIIEYYHRGNFIYQEVRVTGQHAVAVAEGES